VAGLSIRPSTPVEAIVPVLEGADVLINLAGASIVGRWSREYKKVLRQSRLDTTEKIAEAIGQCVNPPHTLLNASAVGIYDSYHQHDEGSHHFAEDFLADLVRSWERAAMLAQTGRTRVCTMRFGVVYGHGGGAMEKMLPPFQWGFGGKTGDGFQMVSWIHLEDLVRGCAFLIERRDIRGVVNLTSPEPITNWEQTKTMGRILRRPVFFTLPGWALKLFFGAGASVLLDSKEVYPKILQESGFEFSYPTFEEAMEQIVRAQG
jgi:uncharacterized protein (TIGR01777 family)